MEAAQLCDDGDEVQGLRGGRFEAAQLAGTVLELLGGGPRQASSLRRAPPWSLRCGVGWGSGAGEPGRHRLLSPHPGERARTNSRCASPMPRRRWRSCRIPLDPKESGGSGIFPSSWRDAAAGSKSAKASRRSSRDFAGPGAGGLKLATVDIVGKKIMGKFCKVSYLSAQTDHHLK
jgi:hypothetical protein